MTGWALRRYHVDRLTDLPKRRRSPLGFWVLGGVLTVALGWLPSADRPQRPQAALRLQLSHSIAPAPVPDAQPQAMLLPVEPEVVVEPVVPATGAASAPVDAPPAPKQRLADSRAQALADWQPTTTASSTTTSNGATVFNPALAARLAQLPARASLSTEPQLLAPDAFGRQSVILGEHCFRVAKVDDQALRGMGAWEPVDCAPGKRPVGAIRLGKLHSTE